MDCQVDGHYPGHLFFIMAIHFLQQRRPPVIPVLHEVTRCDIFIWAYRFLDYEMPGNLKIYSPE